MCGLFPTVLQIDVEDYDNRVFAAGRSLPEASGLRAAVHASPVLGSSLERLSLRTVKAASQRRVSRPRRGAAARRG
jgi:hypothetical protein